MPGLYSPSEARSVDAGLLPSKAVVRNWLHAVVDLIFPPRCAGCGRVDTAWCAQCRAELAAVPFSLTTQAVEHVKDIASTGLHEGKLQQAVHALKYEHVTGLCEPLGERLVRSVETLGWSVDVVIPVPLHAARLVDRGYNQAELLASTVASSLALPCQPRALTRHRETRSQVGLTAAERAENVSDAFSADPAVVNGQAMLLIDDVCTTGSTLNACARALLNAGATTVYGLTVTTAR